MQDFARHYGCSVLPARAYPPQDKAKVELSVLLVERWILARLRKFQFTSVEEVNDAIARLMLQQLVRSIFFAQNVGVENLVWMSGGVQVLGNLSLPYNRLVIIGFAAVVLLSMAWLIGKTRLGLFVRGVTQNRAIASCMGMNTARIDTYAFALGSGIAGLAGCALS